MVSPVKSAGRAKSDVAKNDTESEVCPGVAIVFRETRASENSKPSLSGSPPLITYSELTAKSALFTLFANSIAPSA